MELSLHNQLNLLQFYLENRLASLPVPNESAYMFPAFEVDPDWAMDIGEIGAINHKLEIWLGSRKYSLKLKERGPGIECLADLFKAWTKKFKGDTIILKWVTDVLHTAQDAFHDASVSVSVLVSSKQMRNSCLSGSCPNTIQMPKMMILMLQLQ